MTMLQIRHVPEDLHRRLKARAAMQGVSLSDLALTELQRSMDRPTRQELLARLAAWPPTTSKESGAEAVRAERDSR